MPDYPRRKIIRLPAFDYSSPGAYFITICTHEKRCILAHISVGALHEAPAVHLTTDGEIVRQTIESLPQRYTELKIDNYVVMPNHIHLLLRIEPLRALREAPLQTDETGSGKRSTLAKAIGYLKMNSSKQIHQVDPNIHVWQRSYYDHVIRGERDYQEIWNYIDGNPGRWTEDCFYSK